MFPFTPSHQSLINRIRDKDIGDRLRAKLECLILGTFYKRNLIYDFRVISVV